MTPTRWALLAAWVAVTTWPALRPGDAAGAAQAWEGAQEAFAGRPEHPGWVDVAALQRAVAPGQTGFMQAQARLARIGAWRRQALVGDRGAWPDP